MNTHNVNTAAPESSERCGKTTAMRTDGFITNADSCHPHDVIRADVVLARLEKQAARRCGLFYEIYQSQLLGTALDYLARLPLKDRPVLIGAAAKRGYMLTLEEEQRAQVDYDTLMSQLAEED
ncbi:MAG TPA: hypothetical protein VGL07_18210 [Buttiauxella sp.]|jgi:hypothetical protein